MVHIFRIERAVKNGSKKFLSLKSKLTIILVLFNLLVVFGVPVFYYGYILQKEEANLEVLVEGVEKMSVFRLKEILDPIDLEAIKRAIPRLIIIRELKYIGVFGPDKKLLFEKYEDEKEIETPFEYSFPIIKNEK